MADTSLLRQYLRVAYRFSAVAVAAGCCLSESVFRLMLGSRLPRARQASLHKWSAWVLRRLAVTVTVEGTPPAHGLIVCNHLSYLDILVFSSIVPCAFVSKSEVKAWPGVGWIASLAGTIYIDRSSRSATRLVQPRMEAALSGGALLVLFPEGTSSDGTSLLPFHSSLLQPVIAAGAPITAACLSYQLDDGDPRLDVCYWGKMAMLPHAVKLFRKNGVKARLRFGEQARTFTDRKQAARELHQEVSALANAPAHSAASAMR